MTSRSDFRLAAGIDWAAVAGEFARIGRVRISPFLEEDCARALLDHLRARGDWRLVLNAGEKVFEIDRPGQAAMAAAQREELERRVAAAARVGFQYRFETIRVADDEAGRRERGSLLDAFALFLSSEAVLALMRQVTRASDIAFADAQATHYGPGHFLTAHDDDVEGKGRRAAYVYGLTREWRTEWGGLLLFHARDRDVEQGLAPRFNALNLFAVPQLHSVSYVTPHAPEPRISVTGWLRSGGPDSGQRKSPSSAS